MSNETTANAVRVAVASDKLYNLLTDAALFASADLSRPTLTHVQIKWSERTLRAESTDSYILFRGEIENLDGPTQEWASYVSVTEINGLKTALKADKYRHMATIEYQDGKLLILIGPASFTVGEGADMVSWPNTAALMPTGEPVPTDRIGFTPNLLKRFAQLAGKPVDLVLSFHGPLKPFEWSCGSRHGVGMPAKIHS